MRKIITLMRNLFIRLRSVLVIFYYQNIYRGICFGKKVRAFSKLLVHGPGRIHVGKGTCLASRRAMNELCTTRSDAVVQIGDNCLLTGAIIGAAQKIEIGNRCIIAEAYIRDTSSHGIAPDDRRDPAKAVVRPVKLHDNVWIGSHTHVMPGVTIGKNSIIGVNSVVTHDIPENVFAAGNPSEVKKRICPNGNI